MRYIVNVFLVFISILISGCSEHDYNYRSEHYVEDRKIFSEEEISVLTNTLKSVYQNYSTSIVVAVPPKNFNSDNYWVEFSGLPPDITIIVNEKEYTILRHRAYNGRMSKDLVFEVTTNVFFPEMKKGNFYQAVINTIGFLTNN